jgi:hypothetical protein
MHKKHGNFFWTISAVLLNFRGCGEAAIPEGDSLGQTIRHFCPEAQ